MLNNNRPILFLLNYLDLDYRTFIAEFPFLSSFEYKNFGFFNFHSVYSLRIEKFINDFNKGEDLENIFSSIIKKESFSEHEIHILQKIEKPVFLKHFYVYDLLFLNDKTIDNHSFFKTVFEFSEIDFLEFRDLMTVSKVYRELNFGKNQEDYDKNLINVSSNLPIDLRQKLDNIEYLGIKDYFKILSYYHGLDYDELYKLNDYCIRIFEKIFSFYFDKKYEDFKLYFRKFYENPDLEISNFEYKDRFDFNILKSSKTIYDNVFAEIKEQENNLEFLADEQDSDVNLLEDDLKGNKKRGRPVKNKPYRFDRIFFLVRNNHDKVTALSRNQTILLFKELYKHKVIFSLEDNAVEFANLLEYLTGYSNEMRNEIREIEHTSNDIDAVDKILKDIISNKKSVTKKN